MYPSLNFHEPPPSYSEAVGSSVPSQNSSVTQPQNHAADPLTEKQPPSLNDDSPNSDFVTVAMPQTNPLPNAVPEKKPLTSKIYQFRQQVFSWGERFQIKDSQGETAFVVKRNFFTIGGDILVLEDVHENPLYKIRREFFHLMPHYNILSAATDQNVATVKKKFALFRNVFEIESIYGKYDIDGTGFLAREFTVTKNGQIVATASRKYFSFLDSYGVEIAGEEDHAFIITLITVIDQVLMVQRSTARSTR